MSLLDKIKGKKTDQATAAIPAAAEIKIVSAAKKNKPSKSETAAITEPVSDQPAVKPEKIVSVSGQAVYGVLIAPLITEKSAREEQHNKYAFAVAVKATKNEISKAVETRYGVRPVKINVANALGKSKRFGRVWGKQKDSRKAIVTLPKGKSINVYEAKK